MIGAIKRWLRVGLGWCLVIVGIVLVPLPGPGLPVIFAGLVVLSRDSAWARRMAERTKGYLRSKRERGIECERKSSLSSP